MPPRESNSPGTGTESSEQQLSVPSLAAPAGGGAVRGLGESFESQEFTGSATYSIPIPAPPARGAAPQLNLSYSSSGGNGTFGMGFDVSLSNIALKTSNGIPRYDGSDTFIHSEEGELAPSLIWDDQQKEWRPERRVEPPVDPVWEVVAYRPRHEKNFWRIEQWSRLDTGECHWRVRARDNTLRIYGSTTNARISDPVRPERVFQWLLDQTQDALGNKLLYGYKPEDDENLEPVSYETGRDHSANRYLSTIQYGNYLVAGDEHFAFRLVFDYGEYSIDNPDQAPGKWELRPDPFSSYRSGFEIRTLRRCKNILIYHCFHDQFDGNPVLTRALSIDYMQASELAPPGQPAPDISFVKSVTEIGLRKGNDGDYQQKSLPRLTFNYSDFQPANQQYSELEVEGGKLIPGSLTSGQYLPIDLNGEGIPGLLYSDGTTTLQWQPEGNGRYSGPQPLPRFPLDNDLRSPELAITSLNGDGHPDLLVRAPGRVGYYGLSDTGAWAAFQPFAAAPIDIINPTAEFVDVDGDGRADLLIFDNDQIRSYPSLGFLGYGSPDVAQMQPDFPDASYVGPEEVVTFADMFGDGLAHRVRFRNGIVECWPNLGYGRFGAKVLMGNAPTFDTTFDATKLFVVDLDGTGLADLVYVKSDEVHIYFNQSGNSFSDALIIPLPAPYDELSRITFADINGNGTSCLVLTRLTPTVTHQYYDFAGNLKPYLLMEIDNHIGSFTRIEYSTSVKQYLEDMQAGRTWATPLYFPVQVVASVEYLDQISGARHVTKHKYHDGYYDPDERVFRGFGFVETWDTEDYQASLIAAAELKSEPLDPRLYVPPGYTRTWYHTGVFLNYGVVSSHYASEYWNGDPQAPAVPESRFDPAIYDQQDAQVVEQAYAALSGQMLRQETYGLDESPLAVNPYTVNETSLQVRMIQPRDGNNYAVFLAYVAESLACNYDRNATDPRIQHEFTLLVDEFGNVTQSCAIAYPRRQNTGTIVYPEQQALLIVVNEQSFINHPDTDAEPYRWLGIGCESRNYELEGLNTSGYFSFDDLAEQVADAMQHLLAYGQLFTPGLRQARLFSWTRSYEWNEAQTEALPLRQISSRGLRHHQEEALLPAALVASTFQGKLSTDQLASPAGYWLDQDYWWNRGVVKYYSTTPDQFFLLNRIDGAFAGVDPQSSLNPTSTVEYDGYCLLPIRTMQYIKGQPPTSQVAENPVAAPVVLTVVAENDYQALSASSISDVNNNITEVLYDPLKMVIATTIYGTEAGKPVGDAPLADYQLRPNASFEDVIGNPQQYLQKATSFFFYDVTAWTDRRQPVAVINLHRQTFVSDLAPGETTQIQINITYGDGLGRIVESKLQTDPAPAELRRAKAQTGNPSGAAPAASEIQRWIVSGRTVYNNKGKVAEQYLPWFSTIPTYEDQRLITEQQIGPPPTVFQYDALGRLIRSDSPKGFFSTVVFTSWEIKTYDEDDTVKESSYYKNFPPDPTTPEEKNEKDALDKAAAFYNTPSTAVFDPLGRTVRNLQDNLGALTVSDFDPIVSGSGMTAQQLWDKLVNDGYLERDSTVPTEARVTEKLQPYSAAFQQTFKEQYGAVAVPTLAMLKAACLTTLHELDIAGHEIRVTDPRLLYSNVTAGTDYCNFSYVNAMSGKPLVSRSADAGVNMSLDNVFDNLYWNWSARDFEQVVSYDRLQRRVRVDVKAYKDGDLVSDSLVETFTYGETQTAAENFNLRGQLYRLQDQSGIVVNDLYGLQGNLQETLRQFTIDYQNPINWANDVPLEVEIYKTQTSYNAFRQLVTDTTPDGSVTRYAYNQAGLLVQISVTFPDGTAQAIVSQIQYDANRQRTSIVYANGVTTAYEYETTTLRLLRLNSVRSATGPNGQARSTTLQDIDYTYDPVGNVTRMYDATYQSVFNNNQKVEPLSDYTYDAIYRLIQANGRQHPAINAGTYRNNEADGDFKQSKYSPLPSDSNALENYVENYAYDDAGNLLTTKHQASTSWSYVNEIMPDSNRFKSIGAQNGIVYSYPVAYDNSGNQRQLNINSPVNLFWNCCENLVSARVIERPDEPDDSDYYTYDANEMRTRKCSERLANGGSVTRKDIKLYFGNYEVKLVKNETSSAESTILQRQTLRVMDEQTCLVIVDYWVQDDLQREVEQPGTRKLRFELDDHVGSTSLEVDSDAQLISYEEYFPYGGTALIAGVNQREVQRKVYRYGGKERDDTTGLYYFGARYYAPWLGRFMKPDPAGRVDGLNLYLFAGGNPVNYSDPTGLSKKATQTAQKKSTTRTRKPKRRRQSSDSDEEDESSDEEQSESESESESDSDSSSSSKRPTKRQKSKSKAGKSTTKYEWDIKTLSSHTATDSDLVDILSTFGEPTQSVVKEYSDLADRVGYDVGKSRKGTLSSSTTSDLEQVFEASKPLHFHFNPLLGDSWREELEGYSGSKQKIPLYSAMRSKATANLESTSLSSSVTLNDYLKEVSGRPPEIHHVMFKAAIPDYANQTPNLMLSQRSTRESVYGPGQHELMHQVATGNHRDKFRQLLPQFTEVYKDWLSTQGISDVIVSSKK